jgi:predicted MFS family arabinose efflux permease
MQSLLVLAIGFFVLFVGSGARFAIGLTLKPMAEDFAMGRGMLGTTVAVYYVVTAAFMFISGRLIDRYDARLVLAWGILVSAAGIGLVGLATEPWHLVALYGVAFGIGNGIASITPVSILVTRLYPHRAGMANGIISAGMSAGQLVMIAVMALVLVGIGWRSIYLWLAVSHLVLLPLLLLIAKGAGGAGRTQAATGGGDAADHAGLSLAQAARTRRFWLLLLVYMICGLDDFFVSTHVVAFAQDKGIETLLAGNLLALMGLTAMAGVLWSGVWSDRYGLLKPMLACFLLRIAAFGLVLLTQSQLAVLVFTVVFGITFLMTAPVTVISVRNAFGNRHLGTISGFVVMAHHACGGIGAWLGGVVFDADGKYDTAFAVMLASSIVAVIATLALRRENVEGRLPA